MNIVKKFASSLLFAAALGSLGTANAAIIDTVVEYPHVLVNAQNPFEFFHEITDTGFVYNFDIVNSASISVRLTDGQGGGNEKYRIVLGDQTINAASNVNVQNGTRNDSTGGTFVDIVLSEASLADLNADGRIFLTVSSTRGTFYFADSTLDAVIQNGEVPEPATLALLGLGMLGFAASRRKSANSKNA